MTRCPSCRAACIAVAATSAKLPEAAVQEQEHPAEAEGGVKTRVLTGSITSPRGNGNGSGSGNGDAMRCDAMRYRSARKLLS
ncbi:hypothetical protein SeMB42_g06710 [Synchytrium endobioticum]|uniref:Uncharacterized protein n=1 Tax=Synchytrium endobioticum TaxID=286115 RepID=A0A507CBP5_9FUNG|nr:hypothetical protein SeMB42_g06710 [Synchytrium endobioticum]